MAMFRINAAVLFFAASIPALASPTPWVPTPSCSEAMQQALYALPSSSFESATFDDADTAEVDRTIATVDRRELLAAFAMTLRDIRYRRGGRAPKTGFDCSGFVKAMYEQTVGLILPRRADEQAAATQKIDRQDLKPGDLVFFNTLRRAFSHVGIYIGDNKFIHSPRPGAQVRVEDMGVSYWTKRFSGARRVLAAEPAQTPASGSQ